MELVSNNTLLDHRVISDPRGESFVVTPEAPRIYIEKVIWNFNLPSLNFSQDFEGRSLEIYHFWQILEQSPSLELPVNIMVLHCMLGR